MLEQYSTTNPVYRAAFWNNNSNKNGTMSVNGIFIKSIFCLLLTSAAVAFIWYLFYHGTAIRSYTTGGMIVAILLSIAISFSPSNARYLVPLYAITKGLFLGGLSCYIHQQYPYLALQAVGISLVAFLIMLVLYQTGTVVVTKRLRSVIVASVVIITTLYISAFILSFFGIHLHFIQDASSLSIGFSLFAVVSASFSLLLDFDAIEKQKNTGSKEREWIATWGLLVTLIWLYIEVLRLARKLTIRF
jgi:uncharacterized YccA/Bax inhibitor family protein